MKHARNWLGAVLLTVIVLATGGLVGWRLLQGEEQAERATGPLAVPVEVASVERGVIRIRRVFSGSLEPSFQVTLAPKIAGRIRSLPVDLADTVERGQVVARLDDAELEQDLAQAEADLAVRRAGLSEARSASDMAERELERVKTLNDRGVASESQLDNVRATSLARQAAVQVAEAQVMRAESLVKSARIRLGYATIKADWEGGDDTRVVAERFAEEGDTVSANTPLLSIIELDPVEAIIFATERDYALLDPGQPVTLTTDAYPARTWEGAVARVSPVFREGSRQARIEISVPNADGALKPGMFVRVEAILGSERDATIVPVEALAERDGRTVVFVVDAERLVTRMVPVTVGIRESGRVQIIVGEGHEAIDGDVVTLGQQLLGDESPVTIPASARTPRVESAAERREAGGA